MDLDEAAKILETPHHSKFNDAAGFVLNAYSTLYANDKVQAKSSREWELTCKALRCEEVTAADDITLLQAVGNMELVHPLAQNHIKGVIAELKMNRLATSENDSKSDKHCYYLYYPGHKEKPVAVVYTTLKTVGKKNGHAEYEKLPGDITTIRDRQVSDDVNKPDTMIFYSVSNPLADDKAYFPKLQGIPLGDIVINKAAEMAKKLHPSIKTLSTLSPLRGLAGWLERNPDIADAFDRPLRAIASGIKVEYECPAKFLLDILKDDDQAICPIGVVDKLGRHQKETISNILTTLAAQYLLEERSDSVENFHMGKGAVIGGIRVTLNPAAGQDKVMVNYVRGVGNTEERGRAFKSGEVQIARYIIDDLEKQSGAIERLRFLTGHLKDIDKEFVAFQGGR